MMSKRDIRAEMKSREAEFLGSSDAVAESARILSFIEDMPEFRSASCVLAYMSIPGEVITGDFIGKWAESRKVVLPRVTGDVLELREYDPRFLRPGYRGIYEPSDESVIVAPEEVDFAIIPGVAFSYGPGPDGVPRYYRLGRGKGFYDRLLPELGCMLVGVCFPFRFIGEVPVDAWDMPLDLVVR